MTGTNLHVSYIPQLKPSGIDTKEKVPQAGAEHHISRI